MPDKAMTIALTSLMTEPKFRIWQRWNAKRNKYATNVIQREAQDHRQGSDDNRRADVRQDVYPNGCASPSISQHARSNKRSAKCLAHTGTKGGRRLAKRQTYLLSMSAS